MPSSTTIQRLRHLWEKQPLFLDTETTGLDDKSEIVEICIIDHMADLVFQSLVRPVRSIPADAMRIHGITNEQVSSAPSWLAVWPQVEKVLDGRTVGIYNADFDLRMFQQSHKAIGLPWQPPSMYVFDLMKLFADFSYSSRWLSLEEAGRRCRISLRNTHRALDDALLARQVFLYMLKSA